MAGFLADDFAAFFAVGFLAEGFFAVGLRALTAGFCAACLPGTVLPAWLDFAVDGFFSDI